MRILLMSTMSDLHRFFGLHHHYPAGEIAPAAEAGGETKFSTVDPGRAGSVAEALGAGDAAGPVVAHLTGTSAPMRGAADELRARSIPYLYSPMLPSVPSRLAAFAGRFGPDRGDAMEGVALASAIGAHAAGVLVSDEGSARFFRRKAGLPEGRIVTVPAPAAADELLAGRAPGYGNLALAFCDRLTPEWNVMRFLFAMEKINADAVVVAGGGNGAFARECAARAALNPRVTVYRYTTGGPASPSDEISGFVRRATIIVDPSLRGLGGGAVAALARRGIPGVVSADSVYLSPSAPGLFPFEPSSWELLNHAITSAFNAAAAGSPAGGGGDAASSEERNGQTARILRQLYRDAAGG